MPPFSQMAPATRMPAIKIPRVMRGVPSERPFLGVRVPVIRRIVGRVALENAAQMLREQPVVFEEVLARGMLVCRLPYLEMLFRAEAGHRQRN